MVVMIKCLPREVQGKLRSGVAIPTLQQCVEELILNSIDAGATCVGVRMDMEAFKVQVIDNGAGMSAEDMECVGNRYHTSKCSSLGDLDNLKWYGFRGEALASIISLATLVEISSRTKSSVKTHVKIFKGGKGLDVFEAEATRPSAGTTVIICNFFHNMPVRRKRADPVLEGERIRHRVEAISLMHPSVSFTLRNDCTGAMMVQLPKARSTYHRFVQIHSLERAEKLGEINFKHRQFEVIGYLGREGHYNNSLQFLYVNERLLLKTRLHKLLNFLLRRLSCSNQKSDSPDGHSVIRSPKHKRSQEMYGVYIVNIKCSYSEYDICLEPAKTLIEFKDWDSILLCIEEAVKAFLNRENLVSVFSQDDLNGCVSPKKFFADRTEEANNSNQTGGQSATSTLDCSVGMKLASESVHRTCTDKSPESVLNECNAAESEQSKQKQTHANELEKMHSETCAREECRDKTPCDMDTVQSALHNNVNEEKEATLTKAGEESELVQMSFEPECVLSKDRHINMLPQTGNHTASTCNATSLHRHHQKAQLDLGCNQIIHSDNQCTGRFGQTFGSNRKISLSDPYIHESLQTHDLSQTNAASLQEDLAAKCEEKTSKRKISLDDGWDRSFQRGESTSSVPSKVPRIVSCEKLSTYKASGSLDKFRRLYVKPHGLKFKYQKDCLKNTRVSQEDRIILKPQSASVFPKDIQDESVSQTQEKQETESPPALSVSPIKLQPAIAQSGGKPNLKQHRIEDSAVLLNMSVTTTKNNTYPRSNNNGIQDSNNNDNSCDTAPKLQLVSEVNANPEEVKETAASDWLHHYDTSVGKTVYVNRVTGLSRYEDPAAEETNVCCTSDVTNMAVSVISEMDDDGESSNSLSLLYSKWKNPVFVRPPMVGVDISSGQAEGLAVKIHNILFPYRFSKAMISSMKVIHQVDKKFLACLINTRDEEPVVHTETEGNLLVLVDQHAAHERVRLENLIADSYEDNPDALGERRLCSSTILPPLEISITDDELRLLRSCQAHLRSLGLEIAFPQTADTKVFVGKAPLCFIEKESNELRRGRPSVIRPIVEEYIREQIELLHSTGRVRGTLPLTVLKVLASLACHGAIKFNETLTKDECHSLVVSLSSCQLPFQCAHGRPSIVPLVDILHLDEDQKDFQKPNLKKLRRMYKAWQLYGK
ncbi:DNA mismatch repair protein Mlh3 isoform X1 [Parambassis ranga]|uniref:DNA mismatch repair protein Mlh3 isoform X1 n=1 Tax=Parambassis ranga TaxID=210632 RepID=A0A6P7HJF7_9TELE|nr:DNA mismatch repair protein Mlh3 isoform X1 [Parambassis ranga]